MAHLYKIAHLSTTCPVKGQATKFLNKNKSQGHQGCVSTLADHEAALGFPGKGVVCGAASAPRVSPCLRDPGVHPPHGSHPLPQSLGFPSDPIGVSALQIFLCPQGSLLHPIHISLCAPGILTVSEPYKYPCASRDLGAFVTEAPQMTPNKQ